MNVVKWIRETKNTLRVLFDWCADEVVGSCNRPRPDPSRLLVIRLDQIGDFILWVPVARLLREKYPAGKFHLTLLANQQWAGFAVELGLFDEVWAVFGSRMVREVRYRMAFIRKIRQGRFGTAINPLYSREFVLGDLLVRAAGASKAVGFAAERSNSTWERLFLAIGNRWYSTLVTGRNVLLHETERNREFAAAILGASPDYRTPWLPARPDRALAAHEVRGAYAILAPGSNDVYRSWPVERFAEIGRRLLAQTRLTLVVCGGPGEKYLALALQKAIGDGVVDLVGTTSLAELSELIRNAVLVVTNDTGSAHFCAAHGVPCVAAVGGGFHGRFLPYPPGFCGQPGVAAVATMMDCYGCHWSCIFEIKPGEVFPCIARVEVEQVWNKISQFLELNDVKS